MKFLVILFGVFILSTPAFAQQTAGPVDIMGQIEVFDAIGVSCGVAMEFPDVVVGQEEDELIADLNESSLSFPGATGVANPAQCTVTGENGRSYDIVLASKDALDIGTATHSVSVALAAADVANGLTRTIGGGHDTIHIKGTIAAGLEGETAGVFDDAVGTITVSYE